MKYSLLVVILLFTLICAFPLSAQNEEESSDRSTYGHWLYVGGVGPGNYSRIQDAINDSSYGDTVFVYHGLYYEEIEIFRPGIHLLGEERNNTIIDGSNSRSIITFYASHVTIQNFTLQNCNKSWGDAGISLHSNEIKISNNIIVKNKVGIYFSEHQGECVISGNTIRDNQDGIHFRESNKNNIITKNIFCYNYEALTHAYYSNDNNMISENYFFKNNWTLHVAGKNNTIRNNSFFFNGGGISVGYSSSNNLILYNILYYNEYYGINVYQSSHNIISDNYIVKSWRGIDSEHSNNDTIINNYFILNEGIGIIFANSNDTLVFHNVFQNNNFGIYLISSQGNNITSNNFLQNYHDARSYNRGNTWNMNYWERPRVLPKLIMGNLSGIQFDWHPARSPYNI